MTNQKATDVLQANHGETKMSEDELIGFQEAYKILFDFDKKYKSQNDLSEDFYLGFDQAMNILYFAMQPFKEEVEHLGGEYV